MRDHGGGPIDAERASRGAIAPGRIRRHGLRRLPGATWAAGRSRGSWRTALAQPRQRGGARVDGAGRTDAGVHATGQVIAFTYDGRLAADGPGTSARCAPPGGRRDPRCASGAGRVQPPLCGAVPGVSLHRLERAAQSAPRAHGARGAEPRSTPPRWRGPGRSSSAGTTSAPSGRRTARRSGPSWRSGSGGRAGS